MTKKELLDRCARDGEERVLLARALDKLELARERGIPAHTPFLSPGEQAALEAKFPAGAALGHRDILGALMGLGITREKVGDILLPGPGACQVVVLRDALPILLSQWEGAGRWKVSLEAIPLDRLAPKPAQVKTIRDTVATPRLDAVLAAGFSLSRSKAAGCISAGKVAVNHRECLKSDKLVEEGDVLTCRGLGKCVVKEVPGQSKKGRTMLVLERYV